ncbi:hypothetical protein [uncultured Clostridium sp.]|uniref:hypothetical protein n=1 Tax=uncultured Clostridium sp. TaxID=59620 RepID=UPI0026F3ED3E|nr:hypothetical protein [uncultured Clostridium sp.]
MSGIDVENIRSDKYFNEDLKLRCKLLGKHFNKSLYYRLGILSLGGLLAIGVTATMSSDIAMAEPVISEVSYEDTATIGTTSVMMILQTKENARLEAKRIEEERIKEEKRKAEEAKKKNRYSNKIANVQPQGGRFRLSLYNHSAEQMIHNIDSWLAGYPMAGLGSTIVRVGTAYNVDPYVLTAIATEESGRGKYLANTYNPYGIKNSTYTGYRAFNSFEEAICFLANLLSGKPYLGSGLTTLDQIGRVYCPSPAGWGSRITSHVHAIAK